MAEKSDVRKLALLCQASGNNDIETVRMYIEQGVNLNRKSPLGPTPVEYVTPLGQACYRGNEEIMEELLKAGADPNQVSGHMNVAPMLMATDLYKLTFSMIRTLLSYGANANYSDDNGRTVLHFVASHRCHDVLSVAKLLLENGASFDVQDKDGVTPLYEACRSYDTDLVKLLIAEGADVNYYTGHVTLLTAAKFTNMFDLLLNAGANRHLTPDILINSVNHINMIIKILYTCDVDINMALHSRAGMTILHYACDGTCNLETLRVLLHCGADVRAVSDSGDTALHYAAKNCHYYAILQLLSYNAPLNIKNNENQTPLAKLSYALINQSSESRQQTALADNQLHYDALYQAGVLAFNILVTAGANVTADVEHNLNQFHIKYPEAQIPDYKISSMRSLKEMCRFVIRDTILVPVDASLRKLPITKQLQAYLNLNFAVVLLPDELEMLLKMLTDKLLAS